MNEDIFRILNFVESSIDEINRSREIDPENDLYVIFSACKIYFGYVGFIRDEDAANELLDRVKLQLILNGIQDDFDLELTATYSICTIEMNYSDKFLEKNK